MYIQRIVTSGENEAAGTDELLATETYFHVNIPTVIRKWGKRITKHRELTKILFHIDWISMFYVEESVTGILEMYS